MDAGLRRGPAPRAPSLESNPDLVALIREEIRATGPVTFARFMELALYAPDLCYYTSPATRIGREGDFLTAPETHPIFGAAVARQVADAWRRLGEPGEFAVREYGAGRGALAEAIATTLAVDEPALFASLRYEAVEINPHRRAELADRLARSAPALPFTALDPAAAAGAPGAAGGMVLANEFLDAFPVHRVVQTRSGLREIHVDWQAGRFVEVAGPPSVPGLAARLDGESVRFEEGQRGEIALGLDGWFAEVAAWLQPGVAIVIDYGHPAAELYGPRRRAGTLMGYVEHQPVDDPLAAVGRKDLTAHVDFTAVEAAAAAAGLAVLGSTTQAHFLVALGLEDLLERARSSRDQRLADYLALRSGIVRLLDPRQTGGFRVLAFGRGVDAERPLLGMRPSAP
jgi:SAM-dependent MidA family methyltransferase